MPLSESEKSLYSIEYRDEEDELEIKKVFLSDDELRSLMDAICEFGIRAEVYRLSPGPMPNLDGPLSAVLSGNGRQLLGLPDPNDHR